MEPNLEDLPEEVLCQIFFGVTDIHDARNLFLTNKYFRRVAHACIEFLEADREIIVPARYILPFTSLRHTRNIIIKISSIEDALALAELRNLENGIFISNSDDIVATYLQEFCRLNNGSLMNKVLIFLITNEDSITQLGFDGAYFWLVPGNLDIPKSLATLYNCLVNVVLEVYYEFVATLNWIRRLNIPIETYYHDGK